MKSQLLRMETLSQEDSGGRIGAPRTDAAQIAGYVGSDTRRSTPKANCVR